MDAHKLKTEADRYFDSGKLHEALDAYQRFCEIRPGSLHAWHRQASIHGMLGQFREAANCCEQAIAINPGIAVIHANYGSALAGLERHQEAITAFRKALELDPDDRNSLVGLGNLHRSLNNPEETENCYRRLLALEPDSVEAASQLAVILLELGKTGESIEIAERALTNAPDNRPLLATFMEGCFLAGQFDRASGQIIKANAWNPNLSRLLYRVCRKLYDCGKYTEAAGGLKTVLEIFPEDDYVRLLLTDCLIRLDSIDEASLTLEKLSGGDITLEARIMLGNAYDSIGRAEEAGRHLTDTVSQYPDEAIPLALLSRNLAASGKCAEARTLLEAFLQRHPDSHRILVELGSLHELEGEFSAAGQCYQQALDAEPGYAIAHCRLASLCQSNKKFPAAQQHFEKAIQCDPDLLAAQCGLAFLQCHSGEYSKARATYDKVLQIDPGLEAAISGKAAVLERIGDLEGSTRLLEPLMESGTDNIHTLIAYARASSFSGQETRAIGMLESALDRPGILPDDRMHACFTLGKLLDRIGNYDQAFASYRQGNELNRFPFDRDAQQRFVNTLCSVFSAENMAAFPRSTHPGNNLVFIVGMPRSGTTLTEQILASHPEVHGAGELSHIRNLAAMIPVAAGLNQTFPLCMPEISQAQLDKFSAEHSRAVAALSDGQRFITDKMPSNFMFLGLIELLFPNARILHCTRDPLDTCLSCYFQNFSRGQYFSYNLSDLGFYYREYQRLMKHWKSVLGIQVMDIRYEQLIGNQEEISRKLVEFIGLDWHDDCLDFHRSKRSIRTASYDQVRRPIYKTSVKRWKKYERHLVELVAALSSPE